MTDIHSDQPVRRGPGRPRKQDDVLARPQIRSGRVEVEGREGVVLSRKHSGNVDPFAIPQHIIPDGWDYQWNTYTVVGQLAVDYQQQMHLNGWRPVPAERHPGIFAADDYKGAVIRGGLRLDERPMALTLEALAEEKDKALAQRRDQNAQFGIADRLPYGFAERKFGRDRRAGPGVRNSLEGSDDVPRPRYQIDE